LIVSRLVPNAKPHLLRGLKISRSPSYRMTRLSLRHKTTVHQSID
jgi:hypothetical protein